MPIPIEVVSAEEVGAKILDLFKSKAGDVFKEFSQEDADRLKEIAADAAKIKLAEIKGEDMTSEWKFVVSSLASLNAKYMVKARSAFMDVLQDMAQIGVKALLAAATGL